MKFYINKANGREEIEFETIKLDRDSNIISVYAHTYENADNRNSLDLDTIIYTDEASTAGFKVSNIFKDNYVNIEMKYSRGCNHGFDIRNKYKCYFVANEAMYSMPITPALLRYDANKHCFIIEDLYQSDNDYLISTESVYEYENKCLKYNKVKTTDLAGNVTYQGGEALLLEFTESQKNVLEDLIKLIEKCKDMGIGFRHNEYNRLVAYRMDIHDDRYDDIVMEYEADVEEDDVEMTDYVNPYHIMYLDDYDSNENCYYAVLKRKKNEKDV